MKKSLIIFKCALWLGLCSIGSVSMILGSAYLYLSPALPATERLKNVHFQTPLRIYSQDQKLIAEFGEKRRMPVKINDTPQQLINAFLAAEDDHFHSHLGVDFSSLIRASVQLISTGQIQSGGSTITMQVAKNFFLSHERVFSRKFNEILLALQIEKELTKNEILELYINKIYLGNRAYGIEAAAQIYYNKSINELSLAQMAMIAGLPKAPSKYNPINDPERSIKRRDWILGRMLFLNYIDQSEYDIAINQPITAILNQSSIELQAPYVAEMVRQKMLNQFGKAIYSDGYVVYTTIQSHLQKAANKTATNGLFAYTERHGYRGPLDHIAPITSTPSQKDTESWLLALKRIDYDHLLMPAIVSHIDNTTNTATLLLRNNKIVSLDWQNMKWAKPYIDVNSFKPYPKSVKDILKIGDLIQVRLMSNGQYRLSQLPKAQTSLIAMKPNSGAILSLVGGFNFYETKYNRATQAYRQAGSAFKPFIYLSALKYGLTPATLINDAPVVYTDKAINSVWRPKNDNLTFNGPTRLRRGFFRSRNLISIRVLRRVGVTQTIQYLQKLGFSESALQKNLSLALGNVSITPLQLTSHYASIANGGYQIQSYLIDRIETFKGDAFQSSPIKVCHTCKKTLTAKKTATTSLHKKETPINNKNSTLLLSIPNDDEYSQPFRIAKRIIDSDINYILNDMMKDVIKKGTGRRANVLKRNDLAGKTGTTNNNKDAWFVGFNQNLLTSVWIGMDDNSSLGDREYGSNAALPTWINFMRTAIKNQEETHLPQPESITTVRIDSKTGLLAPSGSKNAIFEFFRKENIPTKKSQNSETEKDNNEKITPVDLF